MALAKKGLIDLPDDASADEFCVVGKNTCNSIFDKLEDNTDREFLPSYHIPAAIAASVWRDKKRKIKPTDWLDFQHAGTAIPYCDAFFTEKSLAHLSMQSDMRLDHEYSCLILSELEVAAEYLIGNL